jgi:Mce-associated membrane protein
MIRTQSRPRAPWLLPAVLGVLIVALLGTSLWLWRRSTPAGDDAPAAVARAAAQNFFTLSYLHPDADLDRVLSLATDPFKTRYSAQRDAVAKGLVEKKLTLTAQVPDNGTALEYRNGDSAQVLVAVDATTATAAGNRETNRYRVRVRLARSVAGWLVADLTQVG